MTQSEDSAQSRFHKPRWYDYVALPLMLLLCLSIPFITMFFESQRVVSPFELTDDPKVSHIRLYQHDVLLGIITSGDVGNPSTRLNLTIESLNNLEFWFFQSYANGYSNKYDSITKYSLKYSFDGENYPLMTDETNTPIHPVKMNDGDVMGFLFNLSLYIESGFINNWINGTFIYLTLVVKVSGWTYRITNPITPVQILYNPPL
ncbi:MAG: hypothetical protein ACFE95_20705 [Candidatus Hodarchaeota archaeon]